MGDRRGVLLGAALFVAIGGLIFPGSGWDDSYITYWAAHALSEFGEIVNYNGDRLEQSSSLGQVVLLALLRRLTGVEISVLGHISSITFGLLALLAAARLGRAISPTDGGWGPAIAGSCAYFVYWSFSGMETSFTALSGLLMLLAATDLLRPGATAWSSWRFAGAVLLYLTTRPETTYVLGATLAGMAGLDLLARTRPRHDAPGATKPTSGAWLRLAVLAAVCVGALLAFRLWYFGSALPQPVSAKVKGLTLQGVLTGWSYLLTNTTPDFAILLLLAAFGAARALLARRTSVAPAAQLSALFVVANLAFAVCSGGDFMPGGRFFVPAIPVAAILAVSALRAVLPQRALPWALALWIVVQLGGVWAFAQVHSRSSPIWSIGGPAPPRFHWFEQANHDHRRYFGVVPELDRLLDYSKPDDGSRTVLFSGQCGFLMYHTLRERFGEVRLLDRFGITTRDFVDCELTSAMPRTAVGVQLPLSGYLESLDEFERHGIPRPDVVFDLFWSDRLQARREQLAGAGFELVYVQPPVPPNPSALIPGRRVSGRAFFAVPADRAAGYKR